MTELWARGSDVILDTSGEEPYLVRRTCGAGDMASVQVPDGRVRAGGAAGQEVRFEVDWPVDVASTTPRGDLATLAAAPSAL